MRNALFVGHRLEHRILLFILLIRCPSSVKYSSENNEVRTSSENSVVLII